MSMEHGHRPGVGTPVSDDSKLEPTLIAKFALSNFAVHKTADGGYLVCRWNFAKHCPDLGALAAFAKLVGVRP